MIPTLQRREEKSCYLSKVQLSFKDVNPGLSPEPKLSITMTSVSKVTAFNSASPVSSIQQAQDIYLLNK